MYRSIIRDPGGDGLVRIVSELQVVDGSVLIVPPDTVAYLVCGGQVSSAYPPGHHTVNTGTSPFFVRWQHLMTNGEIPDTVSVFFVSNSVETVMQMGTGEMLYQHPGFEMTVKVLSPFVVRFHIGDPRLFLSRLVGMYQTQFMQEDLTPAVEAMLIAPVKAMLLRCLNRFGAIALQARLVELSRALTRYLKPRLRQYGIELQAVCITGINLSPEDLNRLQTHEQQIAQWKALTAAEEEYIRRVYGNLQNRTMVEMLTGVPRTPGLNAGAAAPPAGGAGNMLGQMAALPMQMALYQQLFANMRDPLTEMANQSNLFNSNSNTQPQGGNAPPALAVMNCHHCGAALSARTAQCPVCGGRLSE